MTHTIIIAEAGVNHNGSIETAKRLIDVAADSGVDYVKFQTFKTENLVSREAKLAEYQKKNVKDGASYQFEMLKKLELSIEDHYTLIDYCNHKGIKFLSTAFDLESVDFLASLNLGIWKIPSGEITNYLFLKKIAKIGGKIILSTGMSTIEDISNALNVLTKYGVAKDDITILHCNTEYPTPFKDVNLLAMKHIQRMFGTRVGYSDHTQGIDVPVAAVALGASVIEKHFTLDKSLPGPDQKASLDPTELKAMVKSIRTIEVALGDGNKQVSESETKNISVARKSIVASMPIKKGEPFTEDNLTVKRPGTGISPMKWDEVIGKIAKRDFQIDQPIYL